MRENNQSVRNRFTQPCGCSDMNRWANFLVLEQIVRVTHFCAWHRKNCANLPLFNSNNSARNVSDSSSATLFTLISTRGQRNKLTKVSLTNQANLKEGEREREREMKICHHYHFIASAWF